MEENRKEQEAPGTELERSESEVTGAPADQPPREVETPPEEHVEEDQDFETQVTRPRLMAGFQSRRKKRVPHLVKKDTASRKNSFTPEQRLLILDSWTRSGLPAKKYAPLVGVSYQTLAKWKWSFEQHGPEGLLDKQRGVAKGSKLSEATKRAILMMKETNPEYGIQRISDMLYRGLAVSVSPGAISNFLKENGYELEGVPTHRHPDKPRRFERSKPNQLWQTDLFTFILKRQNRRVHLVAFMDDHSRFILGYGLHGSASTPLVLEVLSSAIASYQAPVELLTDNGPQYITWRGKSRFTKECEKHGIKQVVAKPRRPQTLGKIERFWGTLWRECIEAAIFIDMEDARKRIGLFIDYYNFHRPHQGIDGLVPADRFFHAAPDVLDTLKKRVDANALKFAKNGVPKEPFYMTGNLGGKSFSVHAEGERVYMTGANGDKREVDLAAAERPRLTLPEPVAVDGSPDIPMPKDEEREPGTSPFDEGIKKIEEALGATENKDYNHKEGEE